MYDADRILNPVGGTAPGTHPVFGSADFAVSGLGNGRGSARRDRGRVIDEPMGDGRTIVLSIDPKLPSVDGGTQQILWNAILGPNP